MTSELSLSAVVPPNRSGCRLDQVAADLFPDFSRARMQAWIRAGQLTLDGRRAKPNTRLSGGEHLQLDTELMPEGDWLPQDIALNIVYEDEAVIVLDKQAGLVVHPAAGHWDSTLLNGLLFAYPELKSIPRAGIVHRLDKDTSGVMMVARASNSTLAGAFEYNSTRAIVEGNVKQKGTIEAAIGRHPKVRTKMAVVERGGKPAITHFCRQHQYDGFASLSVHLETGRTHQIRVHMAHVGHPLVGDPLYGRRCTKSKTRSEFGLEGLANFSRQALHAEKLAFVHPSSSQPCRFESQLPDDFSALLALLDDEFRL